MNSECDESLDFGVRCVGCCLLKQPSHHCSSPWEHYYNIHRWLGSAVKQCYLPALSLEGRKCIRAPQHKQLRVSNTLLKILDKNLGQLNGAEVSVILVSSSSSFTVASNSSPTLAQPNVRLDTDCLTVFTANGSHQVLWPPSPVVAAWFPYVHHTPCCCGDVHHLLLGVAILCTHQLLADMAGGQLNLPGMPSTIPCKDIL